MHSMICFQRISRTLRGVATFNASVQCSHVLPTTVGSVECCRHRQTFQNFFSAFSISISLMDSLHASFTNHHRRLRRSLKQFVKSLKGSCVRRNLIRLSTRYSPRYSRFDLHSLAQFRGDMRHSSHGRTPGFDMVPQFDVNYRTMESESARRIYGVTTMICFTNGSWVHYTFLLLLRRD